jgi:hypothetical protein
MLRRLIWIGIVLGLIPLAMGAACGGYIGWPGLTTSGADAKVTEELSVSDPGFLDNGLFTYYVNYNNVGGQSMKTVTTYIDHTAPFAVFTSDGLLEQHFNDHVGVLVANATDRNGDGVICWIGCPFEAGDYTIPNAFCPAVGGTGSTKSSNGFEAYCNKGSWLTIVASGFFEETKQTVPGSKYSNALGGGTNFSPTTLGQILASSALNAKTGVLTATINSLALPSGASHTLTTPVSINLYGLYHGIAVDATQPGLKEAAGWLATQFAAQPDGAANVSLTFNGGAATGSITVAAGNAASLALQSYAAR